MFIQDYLSKVRAKYATGDATEHSYRSALEALFESIAPDLAALNEPKRVACGAPDFIITRKNIPVGHCEAKDLHVSLSKMEGANKAQKARYLKALPNLIFTNGLDFEFFKSGELVRTISIGALAGNKIEARPAQFEALTNQLAAFAAAKPQSITSAKMLAEMMAGKAVLIKDIMGKALVYDNDQKLNTDLTGQYAAFKEHLIHEISVDEFADIYAETIAYGMFAARLHDTSLDIFSRAKALELLPKSNPFLRSLFGYIAGVDLDERIKWVIDELADVFQACDLHELMKDFGRFTARNDPFLHFYETFLAEYNPAKRKARGVWYTPEPVVNFIVRAVDEVLQTEFGLPLGLADTSKITIDWDSGQTDAKSKRIVIKKEVHRVQILDPATGTGTFLAEVIKQIAAKVKHVAPAKWSGYVEQELIPRLHGFELLMASYAMCHMKLDMMLTEMGYKPTAVPPRLGVYLTNSLEEGEVVSQNLFAQWLVNEAKSASEIKRQMPIMCIIGNPPYSGHSSNKGAWIERLMGAYKVSPELKLPAQAKWLSDDYVKFIRFSEHMIAKNGEGVLGFITNHGYLDNPTFMDMRHHLRQTFDRIFVLDLHGNAKKKEVSPDGSPDNNVFDIMQGVAIIIAVKRRGVAASKPLASVSHAELWGSRDAKYAALWEPAQALIVQDVTPEASPWRFKPSDKAVEAAYVQGFSLADLFSPNGRPAPGIVTTHDEFAISWSAVEAAEKVERLLATAKESEARQLFRLCSQSQWNYEAAKVALTDSKWRQAITPITYRPFDTRHTVYNSHVAVHRRERAMIHFINRQNLGVQISKQRKSPGEYTNVLAHDLISESSLVSNRTSEIGSSFPLYLYPAEGAFDQTIRVNFDPKIYATISAAAGLSEHTFEPDGSAIVSGAFRRAKGDARPHEVKVFDYIYGVLHSPAYRATYAQFLKIDFPRIPFPASPEVFAHISAKGEALRRLHLMEPAAIGATPYPFLGEGNDVVARPLRTDDGRIMINAGQWFAHVPEVAWNFHIGGYQPAQKWLKDRKGRNLSFEDVLHYQKIIKILCETDRIMKEIELPLPA